MYGEFSFLRVKKKFSNRNHASQLSNPQYKYPFNALKFCNCQIFLKSWPFAGQLSGNFGQSQYTNTVDLQKFARKQKKW
jgi:hypothetical protein